MPRFLKTFLAMAFFISAILPLKAQEAPPVSLSLMVGETDDTPTVGLMLTPEMGWRIYAPAPKGQETVGFVPTLDWAGSENLEKAEPVWPLPEKSYLLDEPSYIYTKPVLVPIHLTPIDPEKPLKLKLNVSLLSCSTLCVPVEKDLQLTLVPGSQENQRVYEALQDIEEDYEGTSLGLILLIALLGGFILNFMPCVLPVLSLKLMHFAGHKEQVSTSSFLLTALGILGSFMVLALLAIGLKLSGEAVGWGMHFQNPYFLLILLTTIVIFAANMVGLFEFQLSGNLTDKASHVGEKSKFRDFFSGVFATLLATPCSAPFVGTSLSFALARDFSDIFLVFMALGIGFASPYFAIMLIPSHKLPLPKPGLWMVWLQRILGIGLLATALWLGFVLSAHMPLWLLGLVALGLILILIQLGWQKHLNWVTLLLTLILVIGAPALRPSDSGFKRLPIISESGPCMDLWCEFDEKAIPELVKQGYIVIVDVTADWCVTCAVNKKLVFESPKITKILADTQVIAMRADWTKQNADITQFLQKYRRFGIPFNIVFGPQAPEGLPMSELLTKGEVLSTLQKAGYEVNSGS